MKHAAIRIVLLVAGLLLLAACAAPEEGSASANPTAREEQTVTDNIGSAPAEPVYECDALFYGDSITADSNFAEYFPDLRIVNCGEYGDTINDLLRRVHEVRDAHPEKVFLLVGINCLTSDNVELCTVEYEELLDTLQAECPDASVCIQSVLPVAAAFEQTGWIDNAAIRRFNEKLKTLAQDRGLPFIDLYSLYEKNGEMNPAMTRDGLHLNFNCYGPWAEAIAPYIGE